MTRQDVIDAMAHPDILGRSPRREWLVEQIMLLVDAYAATLAADQVEKTLARRGLAR